MHAQNTVHWHCSSVSCRQLNQWFPLPGKMVKMVKNVDVDYYLTKEEKKNRQQQKKTITA